MNVETQVEKKEYQEYVKRMTPKANVWVQMGKAFLLGGVICCAGQGIMNLLMGQFELDRQSAGSWCSLILIVIAVVLTGLNLYPSLVKWGGAGALVPITGFANSVASAAMEYQAEGQVFGVGCKIFTIAGPVILYGILASFLLGLIQMLF
ncbi:MAG: SpoVA/SpoVAEb family sporulation membrane protein [Lachnospiraceae bacterium]|nr:SpoVA/SpoVAEb family sporulation membrane protein [Lachnospiraceae bacterium]